MKSPLAISLVAAKFPKISANWFIADEPLESCPLPKSTIFEFSVAIVGEESWKDYKLHIKMHICYNIYTPVGCIDADDIIAEGRCFFSACGGSISSACGFDFFNFANKLLSFSEN
jgi:hypothetical protein